MNDLQLGLIGLGAAAVAAVFAYNKWQEHRHRKLAEKVLARDHEDVLLGRDAEREHASAGEGIEALEREPVMADAVPSVSRPARERQEPSIGDDDRRAAPVIREEPVLHGDEAVPAIDSTAALGTHDSVPPWEAQPEPSETIEPLISGVQAAASASAPPAVPTGNDTQADSPSVRPVPRASSPLASVTDEEGVPAWIVSPAIDFVARFEFVEPVFGHELLQSQADLLARVVKPVGWAGWSDAAGQWERVVANGEYRRVRVGLLLADRNGPVGEADLLTFSRAMQALAESALSVTELPPREPALEAAIALDQFCANVDIQIGLNVISRGTVFPGTKIRALAEAAGLTLDADGRFVRRDDDGNVLFTLANQESAGFHAESMKSMSTHGLQFTLDVARVSHGDRVFAQMLELGRRMADVLGGVLVDDNRRPLSEAMLEPFRRQIAQYQSQLAARGFPAGGPLALRLFA